MRKPGSFYLIIAAGILLLGAIIGSLILFPLWSIAVILPIALAAKLLIKRRHLTFIDEEYSPDIPVEEYRKQEDPS